MPHITDTYHKLSSMDYVNRAAKALEEVKTHAKTVDTTDSLMVCKICVHLICIILLYSI